MKSIVRSVKVVIFIGVIYVLLWDLNRKTDYAVIFLFDNHVGIGSYELFFGAVGVEVLFQNIL